MQEVRVMEFKEFKNGFVRVFRPIFGNKPEKRYLEYAILIFGVALMVGGVRVLSGIAHINGQLSNYELLGAISILFGTGLFLVALHWTFED